MFNTRNLLRCLGTFRWTAACALLFACGSQTALAQSFTWDKVDPAYETQTARSAKVGLKGQIVMGNARLSSNRQAFEDWYRKYLFPAMASPDHLGDLYSNRSSLAKDLERAADPATHQALLDLAYDEAVKRATGNYHPAVRFNAMLIIGNLNQVEWRRVERLPPIRLPKAFDFLLSQLQKPDQLDVLRLAAMVGIERHLRLVAQRPQDQPIPDAKKADVAAVVKTLAEQKAVPDGRLEEIHTWLRRRSIEVLAAIGQVGDGQSIFNTMVTIVADADAPLALRCTAARAVGDLNYADVTGIDSVATTRKLGALVAYACRNEAAWVKEKQKELEKADNANANSGYLAGMGGGLGMDGGGYPGMDGGGYPGMDGGGYPGSGSGDSGSGESNELQILMDNARRRLKLPIYYAQLGIRGEVKKSYGIAGTNRPVLGSVAQLAADDTQKAEIQKILTALDELIDATDLVEDGLEDMMAEVRAKTRELETILPQPVGAEEEASIDNALPGADLPGGGGAPAAPAKKN